MATRAGFSGLHPMPPKICFPTTMARNVPMSTTHQGVAAGRSMANISPMTAALPSPMLTGRLMIRFMMSSQIMAQDMEKVTTPRAGIPY